MYKLRKIFKNEKGQGMVEYGLVLALVSIVAISGLSAIGGNINDRLEGITDSMGDISEPGKGLGYSDEEIDDLINQGYIPVATAEDLNSVRDGLDKNYVQVADIDLSEYGDWNPIGTVVLAENGSIDELASFTTVFTGTYDGGNYAIKDLEIKGGDKILQGLFGATYGATIRNVGLIDNTVTGSIYVGGLVGGAYNSTIENSYATGTVTGANYVGGLLGMDLEDTTISNSYATGSVEGSWYVGGLLGGANSSTVTNSYATGSVEGEEVVGGLVGSANNITIDNSYATGSVTGDYSGGGLVGYASNSTIDNSYATGPVKGTGENIGGLVGGAGESTIDNSYATGSVTGVYSVGGLVGNVRSGTIENSYATGSVEGSGGYVGGLVGYAYSGTIENSHATGSVTGSERNVGGLVGYAYNSTTTTTTNSYWDTETTGQSSSAGGTGKSTDEMKNQATYEGWDFDTTWKINEGEYPTLR